MTESNPLNDLIELTSDIRSVDLISSARRSEAYRVSTHSGESYFLKVRPFDSVDDEITGVNRPGRLLREARVLADAESILGQRLRTCGRSPDGFWILTAWIEGVDCGVRAKALRTDRVGDEFRASVLQLSIDLCDCLDALHGGGYLHGDIQPPHFILTTDGNWTLVDFELTHRPGDKDVEHRGGLVHYNAPEIAKAMGSGQVVDYTLQAEIYSFCALIWVLYTGKPPVDYGQEDFKAVPLPEKLARISSGTLATFQSLKAPAFPQLEQALTKGMSLDPGARFESLSSLREALRDLQDESVVGR